jgi:hypothetical protein
MRIRIFVILMALIYSCAPTISQDKISQVTNDSRTHLKSNLEFLASDELEGRETTKRGAQVAARYIASQLKQYGVEPFGDEGTYFQNFELNRSFFTEKSSISVIGGDDKQNTYQIVKNFYAYSMGDSTPSVNEIVFVGYGITEPKYDYDDYADLDVKGKTVMFLDGEPDREGDSLFFAGKERTKWYRSTKKRALALEKGATGVIVTLNTDSFKRWQRLGMYFSRERLSLPEESKKSISAIIVDSLMVKDIIGKDGVYQDLLNELKPGAIMAKRIKWNLEHVKEKAKARNVVGIINGDMGSVANEIVTAGAHYDHEGIKNGQIYNGADDNGSGTVSLLEAARQLAAIKSNHRPIVFIFYTGEEKGLLGSKYFVDNSAIMKNVIVNINTDMVGRESEDSILSIGSGKLSSEFFKLVEQTNKETANFNLDYSYDDENHPERLYYRSDQWNFAKNNIPIVFFTDMHEEDYHKPTDDADKINYPKLVKVSRLTAAILQKVANLDHKLIVDKANISGI